VIISVEKGSYNNVNSLMEETYCIESSQCYQFTIYDWFSDDIYCSRESADGWYKILYQDQLLLEGAIFSGSELSGLFGDRCPSSSPSSSMPPSNNPGTSFLLTTALVPSTSPSTSAAPTASTALTVSTASKTVPSLTPRIILSLSTSTPLL
jgi:hypothetical protein